MVEIKPVLVGLLHLSSPSEMQNGRDYAEAFQANVLESFLQRGLPKEDLFFASCIAPVSTGDIHAFLELVSRFLNGNQDFSFVCVVVCDGLVFPVSIDLRPFQATVICVAEHNLIHEEGIEPQVVTITKAGDGAYVLPVPSVKEGLGATAQFVGEMCVQAAI